MKKPPRKRQPSASKMPAQTRVKVPPRNLIHKWLLDPRFALEGKTGEVLDAAEVGFVPVEIADDMRVP